MTTKDNTLDEQIDKIYLHYQGMVNTYEARFKLQHNDSRQLDADLEHAKYIRNKSIIDLIEQSNNRARIDELEKMSHINFIATTTVPRTSSDNRPPVTRMSEHILDRINQLQTILNKGGKDNE